MNLFKRVQTSIVRCYGKTLSLFILITILALFAISSILIKQAVVNTHVNLQNQLPAIITIRLDQQALRNTFGRNELPPQNLLQIRSDTIRKIGNLPYVHTFEYSTFWNRLLSNELMRVFNPELYLLTSTPFLGTDHRSLLAWAGIDNLEQFSLKGINQPQVMDIESRLINLVNGRTFTQAEVDKGIPVAIISQDFLEVNQLSIGGTFSMEKRISHLAEDGIFIPEVYFSDENTIASKWIEFEIVGTFERELDKDVIWEPSDIDRHQDFLNRIYTPNRVIESIMEFRQDVLLEKRPPGFEYMIEEFQASEIMGELLRFEQIMFLLHSPIQITDFRNAAENILPEFWVVDDLTHIFADIEAPMETLNEISHAFMIGTAIATLISLSLLIILFFRDRRSEFGIYLALGARKTTILLQNLVEVLVVSVIAISLALLISIPFSSTLSSTMLRNHLISLPLEDDFRNFNPNSPEALGFRVEMSHEEMLELWEVSLNSETIVNFYLLSLLAVIASTVIPNFYVMKISPKEILSKGDSG